MGDVIDLAVARAARAVAKDEAEANDPVSLRVRCEGPRVHLTVFFEDGGATYEVQHVIEGGVLRRITECFVGAYVESRKGQ